MLPPLKYINRHLIKHDRKASRSKGIKFDIDRKEQETNVIHNKIPNCQNENWCKREKFTFLQRVTCNKTHKAFFRKTTWVLVCNSLLLRLHIIIQQEIISTAINPVDYITVKKLIDCQKLLLFSHWFRYWTMPLRTKVQT